MDMSTPTSPYVVHAFYHLLLIESVIFTALILAGVLIWNILFRKRDYHLRLHASIAVKSHDEPYARKWLAIGLGILWIVDGCLQAQPSMSNQFIPQLLAPQIAGLPGLLSKWLAVPLLPWIYHPLFFDTMAVFGQIFLGMLILLYYNRLIGRVALYASMVWSLLIWVEGEAFGGVITGGTWWTGLPGSALIYFVMAVVLLEPASSWSSGQLKRNLASILGILWLLMSFYQILPSNGYWTSDGLANAVIPMAQMKQPAFLVSLLNGEIELFKRYPIASNVLLGMVPLGFAVAWLSRIQRAWLFWSNWIVLSIAWIFGQDWGVLGGLGTDPNTAVPLMLFVGIAYVLHLEHTNNHIEKNNHVKSYFRFNLKPVANLAILTFVGLATSIVFGLFYSNRSLATTMLPALKNAGVSSLNISMPDLTLLNQNGKRVSLDQFKHKVILLTFLDPVCYSDCPVIAGEMVTADRMLGGLSKNVEFVSICANPIIHSVAAIDTFDREHGLQSLKNWEFLTSPNVNTLRNAWKAFYEYVNVQKIGMVAHADYMYFIAPGGVEKYIASTSGDTSLIGSYPTLMADYAIKLLHQSPALLLKAETLPLHSVSGLSHPAGFDGLYMISNSFGYALYTVGPYEELYKTVDGGKTFQNITPVGISTRGGIAVDVVSKDKLGLLVHPYGFEITPNWFVTQNGGRSWAASTVPRHWRQYASIHSPSRSINHEISSQTKLRWENGIDHGITFRAEAVVAKTGLFIAGDEGGRPILSQSSNGGTSWNTWSPKGF